MRIEGDEAQEGHAPKLLPDPGQPTARETEIHDAIHVPIRAWCREGVLGRGRDRQHRRIDDEGGGSSGKNDRDRTSESYPDAQSEVQSPGYLPTVFDQ